MYAMSQILDWTRYLEDDFMMKTTMVAQEWCVEILQGKSDCGLGTKLEYTICNACKTVQRWIKCGGRLAWWDMTQEAGSYKREDGAQYFVSFIDDYNRKLWAFVLKSKDQVLSVFKEF